MPDPLDFAVTRSDDAHGIVLALIGELDLSSASELEDALRRIEPEAHDRLLLDLSRLMFMDSTGLSVLVGAKNQAEAHGRQLVLRRPTPQVRRLFELVGMFNELVIEE